MMFMYARDKLNAQWEKKTIKEEFFSEKLRDQKARHSGSKFLHYSSKDKFLFRDLLGLASKSEWFADYKDTITIESRQGIERFKSPIHFKPIEVKSSSFRVYFEGSQLSLNAMLDKEFTVSNKRGSSFNIKTPPVPFDIDDFLRFAFSIDLEEHIQTKGGGGFSRDKELLKDVYRQIRTNAGISSFRQT
jgi:hypothetical protein